MMPGAFLPSSVARSPAQTRAGWFWPVYACALAVFLVFCLCQAGDQIADSPLAIAALFVNGALALYGQIRAAQARAAAPFISFFFCYLFMAAAPLVQTGAARDPIFTMGSFAVMAGVSGLMFTVIGLFSLRRLIPAQDIANAPGSTAGKNYMRLFLAVLLVSAVALAVFGGTLFTNRSAFSQALSAIFPAVPVALLATTVLQSLPFFGACLGLRTARRDRRRGWVILFAAMLLIAAVLNNPLINPRFKLAGMAFFFIDYMFRGKNIKLLALLLVIGVGMAPLFNAFRYDMNAAPSATARSGFMERTFLSYDYDAFQTSAYAMVRVAQNGTTLGANLLGSVLFFVPRAWWEGKPQRTSQMIYATMSQYRYVGTDNLSTPLMAEGYLGFGWIGVFLVDLLYWLCLSTLTRLSYGDSDGLAFLLRCVFTGMVLIFLRGTLSVGMSALAGAFVSATIAWYLLGATKKKPAVEPLVRPLPS